MALLLLVWVDDKENYQLPLKVSFTFLLNTIARFTITMMKNFIYAVASLLFMNLPYLILTPY